MYLYRMFYKIFVVGYDDDGRMVVFNDLANDEEETHNTMFSKTREFHKISIVLLKLFTAIIIIYTLNHIYCFYSQIIHFQNDNDDGYD